jgi:hypothetical protein
MVFIMAAAAADWTLVKNNWVSFTFGAVRC